MVYLCPSVWYIGSAAVAGMLPPSTLAVDWSNAFFKLEWRT
jgi:hypothetical protein